MQDTQWSIKVVDKLCRRPLHCVCMDQVLDSQDSRLLRESLVLRGLLLADLVHDPSAKEVNTWLRTIGGLTTIDVEQYALSFSALKSLLLSGELIAFQEVSRKGSEQDDFKRRLTALVPIKWIRSVALMLVDRELSFRDWLQWVTFDEKLNFRSLDLRPRMVAEYLADEEELKTRQYDLDEEFLDLCKDALSRFSIQAYPFRPKHGPGATYECGRREAYERNKNTHLYATEELVQYVHARYASADLDDTYWFFAGMDAATSHDCAELVCVPKSMTKNRTISKEPTVRQWLQQDCFQALNDWIHADPLFKYHICLEDQSLSRVMARQGSRDGSYATIDLSKASDSITMNLLRLLAKDTILLDCVETLRSRQCKMPGDAGLVIELEKYAGMGNAICFPIQCLIFSLCCEYACRRSGLSITRDRYRVYGDDIVVDTRAVEPLLEILQQCHFTVNESKSYWTKGPLCFREACGIWCLDGVDITPLRLSRRLVSSTSCDESHAPQSAGWISLCNEAFLYGFHHLHRGLHALVRQHAWYPCVARVGYCRFRDDAGSLPQPFFITWDHNATQWRVRVRWSTKLQRNEYRCACFEGRAHHAPNDENDYFSWWMATLRDKPIPEPGYPAGESFFNTAGSEALRWRLKWVAL